MSFREREALFAAPDGIRLAGTLLEPEGEGPFPALLFASGSGPQNRDEEILGHPFFGDLARWFGARGVASLRFDDRGVGASEGDHAQSSVAQDVEDLGAALAFLKAQEGVDPRRIRLVGHSQGALTCALLAGRAEVEAVAALAGPAEPMPGLIHRQARTAGRELGYAPEVLRHQQATNQAAFDVILRGGSRAEAEALLLDHLLRWPGPPLGTREDLARTAARMAGVLISAPFASLLRIDMAEVWSGMKTPLVAFFGGRDQQVPGFVNLKALRGLLPPQTPFRGRVFPRLNHLFQEAKTGSVREYAGLGAAPAPEVMETLERAFAEVTRPPPAPPPA
ncbi:S9 family peptidase [Neomegalonema sp.]|uniref:alpha/beta hydrolase family protein n=1 Tax=Neomegalonema sp. TaxID=2039713 RepID=UPI00262B4D00|nr:alpha/beta hydrolase [Neomegalonema sp.]MDD2867688.1 alpha/beta fold hydrolase [Neomegalonema sp.]